MRLQCYLMSIELLFGCQILKSAQRHNKLLQIISQSSKKLLISQQQVEDSTLSIAYNKLKLITQSYKMHPSIFSIKIWSENQVFTSLVLHKKAINVIITDDGKKKQILADNNNTIFLSRIQELGQIFESSIFGLQKRCRMEKILRVAQIKNISHESKEFIKKIAHMYTQKTIAKELGIFLAFMRFNTKWYLCRIRKCFNLWAIQAYQSGIDKINEKIVNQEHFCKIYKKNLMKKCMDSWKMLRNTRKKLYSY